ncbi:MAG: hypothetical protein JWN99_1223 [Ilumatobacteraceae bacterium]|nr:hypothetical protein [Ilumatobacteraceae bacterium]
MRIIEELTLSRLGSVPAMEFEGFHSARAKLARAQLAGDRELTSEVVRPFAAVVHSLADRATVDPLIASGIKPSDIASATRYEGEVRCIRAALEIVSRSYGPG